MIAWTVALLAVGAGGCDLVPFERHVSYMVDGGARDVCVPSPEYCDGIDNDCDGLVDNDDPSVLANDINNCGVCGWVCDLDHVATHRCEDGRCGIVACEEGYSDLNQDPRDGCESHCVITGEYDFCDGIDNDCNGVVDDGFDLQSDPNNCGACGFRCSEQYPVDTYHAVAFTCVAGACQVAACEEDYWNPDGLLDDGSGGLGCEYYCVLQFSVEICNGADDDCDGIVDNDPVDTPDCLTAGVCAGTVPECDPLTGSWICPYPATYQRTEDDWHGCDGLDNDCDGVTDEAFNVGQVCYVGQGACREEGITVCNSAGTDSECDGTPGTPGTELCDGLDNDCDGLVDNVARGDPDIPLFGEFVYVADGDFTIFAHEASRPSADAVSEGFGDYDVPCSRPGVLPWSGITAVDVDPLGEVTAREACQRLGTGWDLCTRDQWYRACANGALDAEGNPVSGEPFPYGATYDWDACNGYDFGDGNPPVGPRPTGTLSLCFRDFAGSPVHDLSGNLKEWVIKELAPPGQESFEVRGGAYNTLSYQEYVGGGSYVTVAPGLRCNGVSPMPEGTEIHLPSIGFRCCFHDGNYFTN